MLDDYEKSLLNLKKLGLIQLVDGGTCVRITDMGKKFMELQNKLNEESNENSPSI